MQEERRNGDDAMKNLDKFVALRGSLAPERRLDSKFIDRLHEHAEIVAENLAQNRLPSRSASWTGYGCRTSL
jgi:hypothetical protein